MSEAFKCDKCGQFYGDVPATGWDGLSSLYLEAGKFEVVIRMLPSRSNRTPDTSCPQLCSKCVVDVLDYALDKPRFLESPDETDGRAARQAGRSK